MVDNTANSLDVCGHLSSILDGFIKVKINNVISIVGDSDFVSIRLVGGRGPHSEDWFASSARFETRNFSHRVLVTEGSDLDRDRKSRSQSVAQLRFINC